MITKLFAQKMFEGFSIQRWNDRIRPIDLNEMDKSAFKMIIAYFIAKYEEQKGTVINWNKIISAGFFEFLKKVVLSDIKAPVHRKIKEEYPDEFKELNSWVVEQYDTIIDNKKILNNFSKFLSEKEDLEDINYRILRAAHKYSSYREFEIIKTLNPPSPNLEKVEKELLNDLHDFLDFKGLQLLLTKQQLFELVTIIEQLRFQVRWSQTPRIPRTSVLGHSFLVASFSFVLSYELGIELCDKRIYNNFFCGLFHDLPEAVTRDIISPVKRATKALPEIVSKIEDLILEKELYPLVDHQFIDELKYFTKDEFDNKVKIDNNIKKVEFEEINEKYNEDKYYPLDGKIIKLADEMAAFLEAYQSIQYGIKSTHINEGLTYLKNKYKETNNINGLKVKRFFKEFES
ncbi:MAG: hydrolase [Flavobacteriia bacterium]|nr:MAG: hydrolase [Flavobacteriia bacterium]